MGQQQKIDDQLWKARMEIFDLRNLVSIMAEAITAVEQKKKTNFSRLIVEKAKNSYEKYRRGEKI